MSGKRSEARREAADVLAEMRKVVWTKGGDTDWLDLQVFLGRLGVRLRSAGVPERLTRRLLDAADRHWQSLEDTGDPEIGWSVTRAQADQLTKIEGAVLDWLDRPWHVVRRSKAWRAAGPDKGPS